MNEKQKKFMNNDELEINLVSLLWSVLSRWRSILAFLLGFAVLLGGYRGLGSLRAMRNTEANEAAAASYQNALNEYKSRQAALQGRIDNLLGEMEQQNRYRETSQLFNIDPYNAYVSQVDYYVNVWETEDETAFFRGLNDAVMLVNAYAAAAQKADISAILESAGFINESGFISVLWDAPKSSADVMFTTNMVSSANAVFTLRAVGADREQADAILAAAEAQMQASRAELARVIGEHDLVRLSESRSQAVDQDLIMLHTDFDQKATTISAGMTSAQTELEKLSPPGMTTTTMKTVIRQTVKYGVVGAVVGVFLTVCFYALSFVSKGAVSGADDLRCRYDGELLGAVPGLKKRSKLDRAILCRRGIIGEREEKLRYTAESIRHAAEDADSILLICDQGKASGEELARELAARLDGVKLTAVGNICEDVEAVRAFNEADNLVFVEQLDVSRHAQIRRMMEKAAFGEKNFLGFVITQAK